MENLKNTYQSIHKQYGIDPKEGLATNAFQSVLMSEAESGKISKESLQNSISELEKLIESKKWIMTFESFREKNKK